MILFYSLGCPETHYIAWADLKFIAVVLSTEIIGLEVAVCFEMTYYYNIATILIVSYKAQLKTYVKAYISFLIVVPTTVP